jgi:hypothetical protein
MQTVCSLHSEYDRDPFLFFVRRYKFLTGSQDINCPCNQNGNRQQAQFQKSILKGRMFDSRAVL